MDVGISEVLEARDRRVATQKALLEQFHRSLLCFTMNIPGPEKDSPLIRQGFALGLKQLQAQFSDLTVLHFQETREKTGCTAYFVVDTPAERLKALAIQVEDASPIGRLFDLDVLTPEGKKLSRGQRRKCLICEEDAAVCGRSRRHSVAQLQEKTQFLLWEAVRRDQSQRIAQLAVQSLLYEVCTTPKPGLVDCAGNGSHEDMDIFTFSASSAALFPYFQQCAAAGMDGTDPKAVFASLRFPGKLAEQVMYQATGGVNTHKGAIFSMGILCAAAGMLWDQPRSPESLLAQCAQMTEGITEDLKSAGDTAGKRLYRQYGITGVRGQAEQGFPAVRDIGFPVLKDGLARGLSLNDAGCGALLALIAGTEDTALIARSDPDTQRNAAAQVASLIRKDPFPHRETLEALNQAFREKRLSPGGCADLLAMCYFLHFWTR